MVNIKDFVNQEQIIREIKDKTGFSIAALKEAFDALEEVLIEHMQTATLEQPSEVRLFHGWKIGAKKWPEREMKDPRNGEKILTPERLTPYCSFSIGFRDKINE